MNIDEALRFVETHGVVLESGLGPVPSLASAIAGETIKGSWWGHERGREIFAVTRAIRDNPDIVVCRLIGGKITYVHRRIWPALVRVAARFPRKHLARVHEKHTPAGRHVIAEISFPRWVSPELAAQARSIDETSALTTLGNWSTLPATKRSRARH